MRVHDDLDVGSVVTADCDEVIGSPESGLYKALWVSGIGLEHECAKLATCLGDRVRPVLVDEDDLSTVGP